ncbi:MAG: glutaredoxin 3, partial [Vicinamibacteria bacterium]
MSHEVVIYTGPGCPYCSAAKRLHQEKGVSFREKDAGGDAAVREEMIRRTGRRSIPQIFIGERHVGGFDDLRELASAGELDRL